MCKINNNNNNSNNHGSSASGEPGYWTKLIYVIYWSWHDIEMDPIICASAPSYQSFPWPPESAVMQAAIHLAS